MALTYISRLYILYKMKNGNVVEGGVMETGSCDKCPHCKRKVRLTHICLRCSRSWKSKLARPKQCTFCKSAYWDKPRVRPVKNTMIPVYNIYFVTDAKDKHEREAGRTVMRLSQIVCRCGNIYPRNPVILKQDCPSCKRFNMVRYMNKALSRKQFLLLVKGKVEGKLTYRVERVINEVWQDVNVHRAGETQTYT